MGVQKAAPARRVSKRGSRQKGARGESQFVEAMEACGVPCQRVLSSGSQRGAKADVKVGVTLLPDGSHPPRDEGTCIMRVEVKNRASNPERLYTDRLDEEGILCVPSSRVGPDCVWDYMNQDAVTKAVVLRRNKVPQGAVHNGRWNEVFMVAMGLEDFAELLKRAYPDRLGG